MNDREFKDALRGNFDDTYEARQPGNASLQKSAFVPPDVEKSYITLAEIANYVSTDGYLYFRTMTTHPKSCPCYDWEWEGNYSSYVAKHNITNIIDVGKDMTNRKTFRQLEIILSDTSKYRAEIKIDHKKIRGYLGDTAVGEGSLWSKSIPGIETEELVFGLIRIKESEFVKAVNYLLEAAGDKVKDYF